MRREQIDCFAKGAGGLVIEGRGFHCYTSRRKTEPSNCMPSVSRRAPEARPLNGRPSEPRGVRHRRGQSLLPVLAFRLATPSLLVDLRRLPGLGILPSAMTDP
jgi:hypothetical protein